MRADIEGMFPARKSEVYRLATENEELKSDLQSAQASVANLHAQKQQDQSTLATLQDRLESLKPVSCSSIQIPLHLSIHTSD